MRKLSFWVLSCVLLLSTVAESTVATLRVPPTAVVEGPQITVADVADVRGGSADLRAKLQRIVIGQAPPAGQERLLYGPYIVTRLKRHGLDVDNLRLQVPPRLKVTRASQRLEPRDLEAMVKAAIRDEMPWHPSQVEIGSLRGIEPVVLSTGPVTSKVSFPPNTDFIGPTSFTISFRVAGNLEKRAFGSATIEVTQDMVTTARPIGRHDTIRETDLRVTPMRLSRLPRRVLMRPEDIIGKRTKRALQAHSLIHTYDVEALPIVRKGDAVLILVESPLLKVTTVGEALDHGQRGETIRVRNVSSQRELRAVVVDSKTVKVPF